MTRAKVEKARWRKLSKVRANYGKLAPMPVTQFRRVLGLGFVTLIAGACAPDWEGVFGGGAAEGGSGEGGAANSTSSSNTTSSTSSMGGTSSNSSSVGETVSSTGGQTGSTTTNQASSTSTGETVATSTTTSEVTSTTSGDPPGPTVECGGVACDVSQGGACCFDLNDEQLQCSANDNCSGKEVVLTCDQPDDCTEGTVCCALRDFGQKYYDATSCVQQCNDPSRILCDPNGPPCDPFEIGGFVVQPVCKQSALLPNGYFICSTAL